MAISHRASGTWAYAASGSVTTTLPTHQTGDMVLVRVAYKSSNLASCTASTATSGWAKVGEFTGTGNSGNGTGGVNVAVFWKEATSASETNPTIDFSQTVTQVGHVGISYQKGSTEGWLTPTGAGGEDTTADTSKSMTMASHISTTAGDMVDFFLGIRDDCTVTVPTFTQTGVTYGTVSEQPATAGTDTSGADGAYDGGYRLASSGTSSAAAVVTATLNTSETGSAWTTRLRVQVATNAPAGHASGTGAASNATTEIVTNAGLASGTGTAHNASAQTAKDAPAGLASGTGVAYDATVETAAGITWGPWSEIYSNPVSSAISVDAGHASGTGAAGDTDPSIGVYPTAATGTGTAYNVTADIPNANAGHASGTGVAYDATVSTSTGGELPPQIIMII